MRFPISRGSFSGALTPPPLFLFTLFRFLRSCKGRQMLGFPTNQGCLHCITPANACTLSSCLCSCSSRPPPMPKTSPMSARPYIMPPIMTPLPLPW